MLELTWVRTWWRLHRDEGTPFILLLSEPGSAAAPGRPLALAPLYIRDEGWRDPRRVLRTVCFLGTGEREGDELTGEYTTWLGAPEMMAPMTAAVAARLIEHSGRWDRLKLDRTCPESGIADGLSAALAPMALETGVQRVATFRSPTMPLDKYVQAIPSGNFRHRCRRALRAAKEQGLEFVRASNAAEMTQMFAALRELHQARWGGKGERGVFASPIFTRFHEQIRDSYAREGRMWLVGLRQRGEMADTPGKWLAVRYLLRAGDCLYDYVSGVDTGQSSALAPGLVLHLHTIDACAAEGIGIYDLMAGDYDYKRKLALQESALPTLEILGRSVRSRVWKAARALTRRLRPPKPASDDPDESAGASPPAGAQGGEGVA